jgi:hypothetical protein
MALSPVAATFDRIYRPLCGGGEAWRRNARQSMLCGLHHVAAAAEDFGALVAEDEAHHPYPNLALPAWGGIPVSSAS